MDSMDERVKAFFKKCQTGVNIKQELKDEQFKKLKEVSPSTQLAKKGAEVDLPLMSTSMNVKSFVEAKPLQCDSTNVSSNLLQEYEKTLEDADEKVQVASQMYEMVRNSLVGLKSRTRKIVRAIVLLLCWCTQVDRYLRKLDQELSKFKMELEADHAGITEVLEKRE